MNAEDRIIATFQFGRVEATVEYEPKSDGYNVTVVRGETGITFWDIPYLDAALHQMVVGAMTMKMRAEND